MDADETSILLPCATCARTFMPESLKKHVKICQRNATKKRKPFDSAKQRIQGTELAEFLPKQGKRQRHYHEDKPNAQKSTWKESHNDFLRAIRAARNENGDGIVNTQPTRTALLSGAPTRANEKGVCPTCNRQFGIKAYERHVAWCKERSTRVPISQTTNVAKERLAARMKYRAPPLRNRRQTNRVKYSPGLGSNLSIVNKSSPSSHSAKFKDNLPANNCTKRTDGAMKQKPIIGKSSGQSNGLVRPMKPDVMDNTNRLPHFYPSFRQTPRLPFPVNRVTLFPEIKSKEEYSSDCTFLQNNEELTTDNIYLADRHKQAISHEPGKTDRRRQIKSTKSKTIHIVSTRSESKPNINDVTVKNRINKNVDTVTQPSKTQRNNFINFKVLSEKACELRKDTVRSIENIKTNEDLEIAGLNAWEDIKVAKVGVNVTDNKVSDKGRERNLEIKNQGSTNEDCENESAIQIIRKQQILTLPKLYLSDIQSKENQYPQFNVKTLKNFRFNQKIVGNKCFDESGDIQTKQIIFIERHNIFRILQFDFLPLFAIISRPVYFNCKYTPCKVTDKRTGKEFQAFEKFIHCNCLKNWKAKNFELNVQRILYQPNDKRINIIPFSFKYRTKNVCGNISDYKQYEILELGCSIDEMLDNSAQKKIAKMKNERCDLLFQDGKYIEYTKPFHIQASKQNIIENESFKIMDFCMKPQNLQKFLLKINIGNYSWNNKLQKISAPNEEQYVDFRCIFYVHKSEVLLNDFAKVDRLNFNEHNTKKRQKFKSSSVLKRPTDLKAFQTSYDNLTKMENFQEKSQSFVKSELKNRKNRQSNKNLNGQSERLRYSVKNYLNSHFIKSKMTENSEKECNHKQLFNMSTKLLNETPKNKNHTSFESNIKFYKHIAHSSTNKLAKAVFEKKINDGEKITQMLDNSSEIRRKFYRSMSLLRKNADTLVSLVETRNKDVNVKQPRKMLIQQDEIIEEIALDNSLIKLPKIEKKLQLKNCKQRFSKFPENNYYRQQTLDCFHDYQRNKKNPKGSLEKLTLPPILSRASPTKSGPCNEYDPFLLAEQQMNELLSDTSESIAGDSTVSDSLRSLLPLSHSSAFVKYPYEENGKTISSATTATIGNKAAKDKRTSLIAPPMEFDDVTSDFSSDSTETNSLSREIFLQDFQEFNESTNCDKSELQTPERTVRELGRRMIINKSKALGEEVLDNQTEMINKRHVINGEKTRNILHKILPKVVRPTAVNRSNSIRVASALKPLPERKTNNSVTCDSNKNIGPKQAPLPQKCQSTNLNNKNNKQVSRADSNLSLCSIESSEINLKRANSIFDDVISSLDDNMEPFNSYGFLVKDDSRGNHEMQDGQLSDEEISSPDGYGIQERGKFSADSAYSSTNDVTGRFEDDLTKDKRRRASGFNSLSTTTTPTTTANVNCKMSNFCHECGSRFPKTAKFCCECGMKRLVL